MLDSQELCCDTKMYHLYIKTHRITGLMYLGYTSSKDPEKYRGSGKRWTNHIKKHGYNCWTDIIYSTTNKQEIEELGRYYSEAWNIVESREWANLKFETGDSGYCPLSNSPEARAKALETKRKNGTLKPTPESIAKMLETRARKKQEQLAQQHLLAQSTSDNVNE